MVPYSLLCFMLLIYWHGSIPFSPSKTHRPIPNPHDMDAIMSTIYAWLDNLMKFGKSNDVSNPLDTEIIS